MRKLPPLNDLKAFEAAARLSSVTAAAEELCVTHSSISQRIKQLEAYVGQKLFVRSGRGLEPTPAAVAYYEDLRISFDRIALATDRLTKNGLRRTLSVNTTPSFAMRWLIPRTLEFHTEHPSIELVTSTSKSDDISSLDRPHDFIIRREPMTEPDHDCVRLLDDVMTPVMAPDLLEQQPIHEPADLLNYTHLHMRSRSHAWKQWFGRHGVATPETIGGPFFDHFFLSLQAAINGLGVAIGPYALIEDDIASGRLVAPLPGHTVAGPGFHLLYRRSVLKERAGEAFISWLFKSAAA